MKSLEPVRISTKAKWPVDSELEKRQAEAAAKLGPNSIRPLLVEEHPYEDVTRRVTSGPIDWDSLPV